MTYVIAHPDIEGTAVIAEQALATYASKGWALADRPAAPTSPTPARDLKMPARSASAAEWKTYAVVKDVPYAEAMAATRDQLADHFAPKPEGPAPKPPRKRSPRPKATAQPATPPADAPDPAVTTADTTQEP